jgi:hypothetical protein
MAVSCFFIYTNRMQFNLFLYGRGFFGKKREIVNNSKFYKKHQRIYTVKPEKNTFTMTEKLSPGKIESLLPVLKDLAELINSFIPPPPRHVPYIIHIFFKLQEGFPHSNV